MALNMKDQIGVNQIHFSVVHFEIELSLFLTVPLFSVTVTIPLSHHGTHATNAPCIFLLREGTHQRCRFEEVAREQRGSCFPMHCISFQLHALIYLSIITHYIFLLSIHFQIRSTLSLSEPIICMHLMFGQNLSGF